MRILSFALVSLALTATSCGAGSIGMSFDDASKGSQAQATVFLGQ